MEMGWSFRYLVLCWCVDLQGPQWGPQVMIQEMGLLVYDDWFDGIDGTDRVGDDQFGE